MARDRIPFQDLSATDFEEFCFELLPDLGFVNVDWRKGSNTDASPADRGRDIVAEVERTDVDGTRHTETWFIEVKHHDKAVPPTAVQGLLAWSHAERPHTALVIASGFLSNPAKDYLKDYEENNRPPFRVKYWERPILERLADGKDDLLARFLLTGIRSHTEIVEAENEFFDRVWHERHLMFRQAFEKGDREETPREIYEMALQAAKEVRERLGETPGPYSDFEWGMVNGKLSALRWILGSEWDFLDT